MRVFLITALLASLVQGLPQPSAATTQTFLICNSPAGVLLCLTDDANLSTRVIETFRWSFDVTNEVMPPTGVPTLVQSQDNTCLDTAAFDSAGDATTAITKPCDGSRTQLWTIKAVGGSFVFHGNHQGHDKCLGVLGQDQLNLRHCNNPSQMFNIT